jgi:hypothetical protein
VLEPIDVKMPLDPMIVQEYEERVFKFSAGFYITVLQRSQNK